MAVAALRASGTLTLVAGGLDAKVTTAAQPKALHGLCLASFYDAAKSMNNLYYDYCLWISLGTDFGLNAVLKDWWQRRLGGQRLSVRLGTRILNALRLGKYASWGAGPLGFFVIAG